jgi:hypothetical protein
MSSLDSSSYKYLGAQQDTKLVDTPLRHPHYCKMMILLMSTLVPAQLPHVDDVPRLWPQPVSVSNGTGDLLLDPASFKMEDRSNTSSPSDILEWNMQFYTADIFVRVSPSAPAPAPAPPTPPPSCATDPSFSKCGEFTFQAQCESADNGPGCCQWCPTSASPSCQHTTAPCTPPPTTPPAPLTTLAIVLLAPVGPPAAAAEYPVLGMDESYTLTLSHPLATLRANTVWYGIDCVAPACAWGMFCCLHKSSFTNLTNAIHTPLSVLFTDI